eukprot:363169-Chlamydomonas_euryale.AAC.6
MPVDERHGENHALAPVLPRFKCWPAGCGKSTRVVRVEAPARWQLCALGQRSCTLLFRASHHCVSLCGGGNWIEVNGHSGWALAVGQPAARQRALNICDS